MSLTTYDMVTRAVYAAHIELTVPTEWIFLKTSDIPLLSKAFPKIQENTIRWRCTTNPPRFLDTFTDDYDLKNISYLGFSVNIPGYDIIDLTEWMSGVKWSGRSEPTLQELFILWCCEKGISYFHCLSDAKAEVITETGDVITKGLNGFLRTHNSADERSSRR